MNKTIIHGPFGGSQWGSCSAVLNAAVRTEGVPLNRVENFIIGTDSISDGAKEIARFQWFEGIDNPLFLWTHPDYRIYNHQKMVIQEDKTLLPQFRLTLSCHLMPAFEISGIDATEELHWFLKRMLTNLTTDECYQIHQNAGAFFQGGSHNPHGQWSLIEFWKPEGAQAFIDYLNKNYKP